MYFHSRCDLCYLFKSVILWVLSWWKTTHFRRRVMSSRWLQIHILKLCVWINNNKKKTIQSKLVIFQSNNYFLKSCNIISYTHGVRSTSDFFLIVHNMYYYQHYNIHISTNLFWYRLCIYRSRSREKNKNYWNRTILFYPKISVPVLVRVQDKK